MDRRVIRFVRLVAAFALVAGVAIVVVWPPEARVAHGLLWGAVATVILTVAEIPFAHIRLRLHGESFTTGEGVLFVVLALFNPGAVILMVTIAGVIAQGTWRSAPIKKVFNSAQYVFSVGGGALVAYQLGWNASFGSVRHLLSCVAGVVTYEVINRALVMRVVSLANSSKWFRSVASGLPVVGLTILGLSPIGALAVVLVAKAPHWLPLLAVPVGSFFLAQRRAVLGARRAEITDGLLELGDDLNAALDIDVRTLVLADGVRSMLRAESAEVILFSPSGLATRTRTSVEGPPEILTPVGVGLDTSPSPYAHVIATGESHLYLTARSDSPLLNNLAAQGVRDMISAPMTVDGEICGILLAINKLGPESFAEEDLKVLTGAAQLAAGPLVSAQAYAAEKASVERLRELDRMKSDFIASVSHELRTPLTLIHGFALTLHGRRDSLEVDEQRGYLEKIVRNSTRLTRLIEGVLAASRWEVRQAEDDSSTDLVAVVRDVIDQLLALNVDRQVLVDVPTGLPKILAADERVEHVLRNLVENALKYSDPPTPVVIRGRSGENGIEVEVIDRGPGIPEDQRDRVFDRFFQLDQSSTRRVGGTGLGLYLVKNLTEAVGGQVEVTSELGKGTTFRVTFPAEREAQVISFPTRQEKAT